jgi:hypothetical protein
MTLLRKILSILSFGRRGGGCHREGEHIDNNGLRVETFSNFFVLFIANKSHKKQCLESQGGVLNFSHGADGLATRWRNGRR